MCKITALESPIENYSHINYIKRNYTYIKKKSSPKEKKGDKKKKKNTNTDTNTNTTNFHLISKPNESV